MYSNSGDFSTFRIGGGATASSITAGMLVLMLLAIGLILVMPRREIVLPLICGWILAPFGQQFYVGGTHLFIGRILILAGLCRIASSRRPEGAGFFAGGFTLLDKVFIAWAVCRALATYLEFLEPQAIVTQCGFLLDTVAAYALLRTLIRDERDITRVLHTLAVLVMILGVSMAIENLRQFNLFGYLGSRTIPDSREGRIRAQGPFLGPIPAGTFAATLFPMLMWLWRGAKSRLACIAGSAGALVVVVASASSTPLLALAAVAVGVGMWPVRKRMRAVRWGIVGFLVCLQLVMKAPVWWAIDHVDLVGGNSSYHRAMIVDQFITHFSDWWLIGVKSTAEWGWDMWDGANQFVAEGESGGLATFICFVLLVAWTLGRIGTARRSVAGDKPREWFFWSLGITMFSFVVSFFGISFSDQAQVGWLVILAISAVTTAPFCHATSSIPITPVFAPLEKAKAGNWETFPAPSRAQGNDSWDRWRVG